MKSAIFTICLLLVTSSLACAAENPFLQFNSDVEKAYAAYRKALFQTNKKDAEKSGKANGEFIQQWKQIRQKYGNKPPEVFRSDVKWQTTLSDIEEIALKSAGQIKEGHLSDAHETLEAIRDELTDLRRRNSVVVFSDHINNYHEVMEGLLMRGYNPGNIDEKAVAEIRSHLAVLNYLAGTIKDHAPVRLRENQQYQQLEKGLFESLEALANAVESKDPALIAKSINMLKPAYAKLFVNFG